MIIVYSRCESRPTISGDQILDCGGGEAAVDWARTTR